MDDYAIKSINIIFQNTTGHLKSYDGETKLIYFWIKDDELLKNYNDIWNTLSNGLKKEFDSKPIYNKHFWKKK